MMFNIFFSQVPVLMWLAHLLIFFLLWQQWFNDSNPFFSLILAISKKRGKKIKKIYFDFLDFKLYYLFPICSPLGFRCMSAQSERHTISPDARAMGPAKMTFSKVKWKENDFEAQEDANIQCFLPTLWLTVRHSQWFLRNRHLFFQLIHFFSPSLLKCEN